MTDHAERLAEALEYVLNAHGEQLTDAFDQAHRALSAYRSRAPEAVGDEVERAARAVWPIIAVAVTGREAPPLDLALHDDKEWAAEVARAAIAAMRTPPAQEPQG